jgi:phosphonatase-like hydrolase
MTRLKPIRLAVFDMAGTTVYDGDAVHRCLMEALRAEGVAANRPAVNAVMGLPKPLAIQTLIEQAEASPADPERVRRVHAEFVERMNRYYAEDPAVREIAGASETFRALRERGVRVALDTGFSRPLADTILSRLGWRESGRLDATVTSDEVERGRPHPDMIFRAMSLTGVADPAQVAKIGDTPSDLQEGAAAGCGWVIGVTEGSHSREELSAFPHTHLIPTVAALIPLLFGEASGATRETG